MTPLDCDVARDLMPLCLEDVASETSRAQVNEHVQNCEDCRLVYEDMKKDPQAVPAPAPDEVKLSAAFKKLLRAIRMKHLLWLMIGALAAAILITAGSYAHMKLFVDADTPIPPKFIEAQLLEMSSGHVLIETKAVEGHNLHGFSGSFVPEEGLIYISPVKPVFDLSDVSTEPFTFTQDLRMKDGVMYQGGFEDVPDSGRTKWVWHSYQDVVKEIRLGTPEDYVVLYQQGDTLPPCPKELEEQYLYLVPEDGDVSWPKG
jgi:hypothetical protein